MKELLGYKIKELKGKYETLWGYITVDYQSRYNIEKLIRKMDCIEYYDESKGKEFKVLYMNSDGTWNSTYYYYDKIEFNEDEELMLISIKFYRGLDYASKLSAILYLTENYDYQYIFSYEYGGSISGLVLTPKDTKNNNYSNTTTEYRDIYNVKDYMIDNGYDPETESVEDMYGID